MQSDMKDSHNNKKRLFVKIFQIGDNVAVKVPEEDMTKVRFIRVKFLMI